MVELVIVVVIVAIIASIALARFSGFAERTEQAAIGEHLRRMATAFELYHADHDAWPADTLPGVFPPEMSGYLREGDFRGDPLGGKFDWEQWGDPPKHAVGYFVSVHNVQDWGTALEIDRQVDNGDLNSGAMRAYSGKWFLLEVAQ